MFQATHRDANGLAGGLKALHTAWFLLRMVISNANSKCCKKTNKAQANCAQIQAIDMQDVGSFNKYCSLSIDKYLEHLVNLLASSQFNSIKTHLGLCLVFHKAVEFFILKLWLFLLQLVFNLHSVIHTGKILSKVFQMSSLVGI